MAMTTTNRMTADERRHQIIELAAEEFAERGLHGVSAETIARRAGVTQPYVLRLFGTKKLLFTEVVKWSFGHIIESFTQATAGLRGNNALVAMGQRYRDLLKDRTFLLLQLHAFAACDDPEVREVVREQFGRLWTVVKMSSGVSDLRVKRFLSVGMLLNDVAAMSLDEVDEPWAQSLWDRVPAEKL